MTQAGRSGLNGPQTAQHPNRRSLQAETGSQTNLTCAFHLTGAELPVPAQNESS